MFRIGNVNIFFFLLALFVTENDPSSEDSEFLL
jgi:hypothetical protein